MSATAPQAYEESRNPILRRTRALLRGVKWHLKSFLGIPRTVLVDLRWRLGDEIMALPIFESLRARYPAARILVQSNYPDLFENQPFIDAVNPPSQSIDRYLLLRGASRQQYRLACYAQKARVALPVLRPQLYLQDTTTPFLSKIPAGDGPLIALAPGASWPTKRWLPERWQNLVQRLSEGGARVFELGQDDDATGAPVSFMNRTTVREAACLLHHADVLICCDSGLMHLALAVNTPVVALFGLTDPDILIRNEPLFYPIRSTLPCSGYWNHADTVSQPGVCPEGHTSCIADITVEQVLEILTQRLVTLDKP